MNEKQLSNLLKDPEAVDEKIDFYIKNKILMRTECDNAEIKGHVEKAEHNANFIQDTLKQDYTD